jgi:hypothetical protein
MKIYFETAKGSLEQLKSNRCNDYLDNECNSFANTCKNPKLGKLGIGVRIGFENQYKVSKL